MDIAEFHQLMRDKYAEKEEREHRLLMWILGLLALFSLVVLAISGTRRSGRSEGRD